MCGLVGIAVREHGVKFPVDLFKELMEEARIRGQHATGIGWATAFGSHVEKQAVPHDKFVYPMGFDQSVVAIGHLRYSTSDLEFNQPNFGNEMTLVHNGVVSQEPPETWEETFGVKCQTRNDSEILLQLMEQNRMHPLHLVNTSQACIAIQADGSDPREHILMFWRNEQRPLYYYNGHPDYIVVASTADIIKRVMNVFPTACIPCDTYSYVVGDGLLYHTQVRKPLEDLQNV